MLSLALCMEIGDFVTYGREGPFEVLSSEEFSAMGFCSVLVASELPISVIRLLEVCFGVSGIVFGKFWRLLPWRAM